jgi:hypothetical protein
LDFLKLKTGLEYDIHIIAEIGHNAPFPCYLKSDTHVRKTIKQERIPTSHISDLIFYYRTLTVGAAEHCQWWDILGTLREIFLESWQIM